MDEWKITIFVDSEEQKDAILDVLNSGEEEGELDFPFTVRVDAQ